MPTTLALDDDGDLNLQNGLGPFLVSGVDAVKCFLFARFTTQAGEWGYDKTFGMPYNEAVTGRYFDDVAVAGIYADQATHTPGTMPTSIHSITFSIDPETRKLSPLISPVRLAVTGEPFDYQVPT